MTEIEIKDNAQDVMIGILYSLAEAAKKNDGELHRDSITAGFAAAINYFDVHQRGFANKISLLIMEKSVQENPQ